MTFTRMMLGTVQFGLPYGIANATGQPSFETVLEILRTACELGVTSLDTSASYGNSEEVLGHALSQLGVTRKMQIVTKVPPVPQEATHDQIISHIDFSLTRSFRRLKTDHLAAALFHFEGDAIHLPILRTWIDKGDIEWAGVSLDSDGYDRQAVAAADAVQVPCNILDHRFDSFIEESPGRKAMVFARSVYLQGFLLMPEEKVPAHLTPLLEWRRRLETVARSAGITLAELAVRYLYSQHGVTSVLTGVDSVEQLKKNVACTRKGPLPPDLFCQVRDAVPLLPESLIRPMLWHVPAPRPSAP